MFLFQVWFGLIFKYIVEKVPSSKRVPFELIFFVVYSWKKFIDLCYRSKRKFSEIILLTLYDSVVLCVYGYWGRRFLKFANTIYKSKYNTGKISICILMKIEIFSRILTNIFVFFHTMVWYICVSNATKTLLRYIHIEITITV